MPDAEVEFYDPWQRDAGWANRLFGAVGINDIDAIREGLTLVCASNDDDTIEAIMRIESPALFIPALGALSFGERLTDDDLFMIEPDRFQVLDVIDIATALTTVPAVEGLIASLPFKAYRIEHGRTAPMSEAAVEDFDWRPELPNPSA